LGDLASCRRSSVYLLAGSMTGMMWQDTAGPTDAALVAAASEQ